MQVHPIASATLAFVNAVYNVCPRHPYVLHILRCMLMILLVLGVAESREVRQTRPGTGR